VEHSDESVVRFERSEACRADHMARVRLNISQPDVPIETDVTSEAPCPQGLEIVADGDPAADVEYV
jgi:hypothetical protein